MRRSTDMKKSIVAKSQARCRRSPRVTKCRGAWCFPWRPRGASGTLLIRHRRGIGTLARPGPPRMSAVGPRIIPSIEQLRQRPGIAALEQQHGHDRRSPRCARRRTGCGSRFDASGDTPGLPTDADRAASLIESRVTASLSAQARGSLIPVINATGVIVHTNLGRAPLAASALQRVTQVGRGYANLRVRPRRRPARLAARPR